MTRGLRGWNRTIAAVVGLVLLACGVAAIMWWTGTLGSWWSQTPDSLDAAQTTQITTTSWWRWVCAVGGVVLVVLGLWWLLAHLRTTRVGMLRLDGSDRSGRLAIESPAAIDHLRVLVADLPRVKGCSASLKRERQGDVLVLTARIRADANVESIAESLASLAKEFAIVTGESDLGVRLHLHVIRRVRRPERELA